MYEADRTVYGLIKPSVDAHILGLQTVAGILEDCGYPVIMADDRICEAFQYIRHEVRRQEVLDWLAARRITRLGISYRLDEEDALDLVGRLVEEMKAGGLFHYQGGPVDAVYFAGLPAACHAIDQAFKGLVTSFEAGVPPAETLLAMGVPSERIPPDIREGCPYDQARMDFGRELVRSGAYRDLLPPPRQAYPDYGSRKDGLVKRLEACHPGRPPLIRAHAGPYLPHAAREESVLEFVDWAGRLSLSGWLDILSIGTSQLTQSHFGLDWQDLPNGGGVPVNSPEEYRMIYDVSRPLLVRTYAGTRHIADLARMHEESMNICWHAFSFWWFNQLDGRGPYDLLANLVQHMEALDYAARSGKPFEANVSHHFAFRGSDDVSYIVSAYLAAKLAKKKGIRTFVLQNMLNTPRLTWGIQDLAKSRALLALVRRLEDGHFRVLLQPRAGLDYFKPDLEEARAQLAASAALMDDIEPGDRSSPPLIHVVAFSEASHLATPQVIDESIQITLFALKRYRELRSQGLADDMAMQEEVRERTALLFSQAEEVVADIEGALDDPYSARGFYKIFAAGYLPVPDLWEAPDEFRYAKSWTSRPVKGGVSLVDPVSGRPLDIRERLALARGKLEEAAYALEEAGAFPTP